MSEQPPRDDLLERLRRVESGSPRGEFMTNWHRNPDGPEAADRIERLRAACSRQNEEICQVLGKALGYPWFKDDPANFPDATEEHGVCVGDHVAESLADEAAKRIERLERALAETKAALSDATAALASISGLAQAATKSAVAALQEPGHG
jgi:hypothetical protein